MVSTTLFLFLIQLEMKLIAIKIIGIKFIKIKNNNFLSFKEF